MGLSIRRPVSLQTVWLHIDRLDRSDGRVWAVQWRDVLGAPHYKAIHEVTMLAEGHTVRFGAAGKSRGALQPRAVVVFRPATVRVRKDGEYWRAVIFSQGDSRQSIDAAVTIFAGASRTTSSAVVGKRRARV